MFSQLIQTAGMCGGRPRAVQLYRATIIDRVTNNGVKITVEDPDHFII